MVPLHTRINIGDHNPFTLEAVLRPELVSLGIRDTPVGDRIRGSARREKDTSREQIARPGCLHRLNDRVDIKSAQSTHGLNI